MIMKAISRHPIIGGSLRFLITRDILDSGSLLRISSNLARLAAEALPTAAVRPEIAVRCIA